MMNETKWVPAAQISTVDLRATTTVKRVTVTVSKLARPEHSGDWHDKPLKWQAVGPGNEVQKFQTRKNAEKYASLRRRMSEREAGRAYANS